MYTVYQVVLVSEDGEYPQSDWVTEDRAFQEAEKLNAGLEGSDGARAYIVTRIRREF